MEANEIQYMYLKIITLAPFAPLWTTIKGNIEWKHNTIKTKIKFN